MAMVWMLPVNAVWHLSTVLLSPIYASITSIWPHYLGKRAVDLQQVSLKNFMDELPNLCTGQQQPASGAAAVLLIKLHLQRHMRALMNV